MELYDQDLGSWVKIGVSLAKIGFGAKAGAYGTKFGGSEALIRI